MFTRYNINIIKKGRDTAVEIWECLYNARNEGVLFLPPRISQPGRSALEDFINAFELTAEQKERFQDLLNEFYHNTEKNGFGDGVKIALRLYSE